MFNRRRNASIDCFPSQETWAEAATVSTAQEPAKRAAILPPVSVIFSGLEQARGVVLAVSGGPDSTALMHLAARWRREGQRPSITVASVDHGLRAGSRLEAEAVVRAAETLGLAARCLVWDGPKPQLAVQETARDARYALLVSFARSINADHLATGHTLDDQAETLLFRMARGSGLTGLCGMRSRSDRNGITHARPLLGLSKADLVAACRTGRWEFVEDPSNQNIAFARSRWRRLMPLLATEGLTADRIGQLARRMVRADDALNAAALTASHSSRRPSDRNEASFDFASLATWPEEIVIRVLAMTLTAFSGDGLRLERLESLSRDLLQRYRSNERLSRTLHHCTVVLDEVGLLTIGPETRPRRRGLG